MYLTILKIFKLKSFRTHEEISYLQNFNVQNVQIFNFNYFKFYFKLENFNDKRFEELKKIVIY